MIAVNFLKLTILIFEPEILTLPYIRMAENALCICGMELQRHKNRCAKSCASECQQLPDNKENDFLFANFCFLNLNLLNLVAGYPVNWR